MPLTPQSRIYEEKLANRRKKQQMRDDISKSRFQGNSKPVESFSSPAPKDNRTSVNRFGTGPVTHKDGIPDFLFQKAVETGMDIAKDTGISAAQILNESANLGGGRAIFGKDYVARGAGKLFGQEAQNTVSGEVTPMDILNAANLVPGAGTAVGKTIGLGFKGAKYGIEYGPTALSMAKKTSLGSKGLRYSYPSANQGVAFKTLNIGPKGVRLKSTPITAGGAPKAGERAKNLAEEIINDATSKADQTVHSGVVDATGRAYTQASPSGRLGSELQDLWRAAGETGEFPMGATSDVFHVLGAKQQSPSFAEALTQRALSALPSRGGTLRTQGVLVPYSEGKVEGVPLADIIDYLHLGDEAGRAAKGMPKSNITGSGFLRVGVEGPASRTARYNKMASSEATGVKDISESISGGFKSMAQEPRRLEKEVAGVFAPRDAFFREGVAPSIVDLQNASDATRGIKSYNIDRIEPKTHLGILEGLANALTKGAMSEKDRKFFADLYSKILSPENSILTGGSFNQAKSDLTAQNKILNALITERRNLETTAGSVYVPKTIEELAVYSDPTTKAGEAYSKLFNSEYSPILGHALSNVEAFAGHNPSLIRDVVEGVQKVRQVARKTTGKEDTVKNFLEEVGGIMSSTKKDADKQLQLKLLLDKALGKISEQQMGLELGM